MINMMCDYIITDNKECEGKKRKRRQKRKKKAE